MFNSQLTAFVCAADSGSFSKAAETLYISSTAVMKQINALEKHLDLKLLERSSRGISLTPAGNVIYKYAQRIFDESETAICEARLVASEAETTFCVGTSILNPCKPFMDLWYQINEQFPGYKLHIVPFEDNHEGILGEIASLGTKFDFLIGACDSRQWLDRCNFLQLGTYRHCVAVPREHRLAQKPLLTISDLYGETLMMVRKGDSPTVDRVRAEIEQHPRIRIEDTPQFYDMEVFNRCVQTRHIMMTLDCWTDVHPGLVTIPVDWPFTIPYGILYQLEPGADIQQFLALVKASHPAG
ncbi:MAG: LysR family transcriptional regulator [Oscillospiraceae bacterium]|nr:LysR family transcriptional regulator [Clostridiales bacterium]MDY6094947.1 LysR family transcriptional regulator [Oscillospiraceae bacterium]